MSKTTNNLKVNYVIAAIFSLLVLVFVSSDIAVPIVRNIVIILSGISSLVFEYLLFINSNTKSARIQGMILMVLTILIIIFQFIA